MAVVSMAVAVGMIVIGGMVSSSCKPLFNLMSQQLFKFFPNELLPPVSLITLRYRGEIDEDRYLKECELSGINDERARLLYTEAEQRLTAYDVINLWRRGGIDETTRDERIMQAGWTEDRIPGLLDLTRQIPSASDVIAFAVREVYSPEIAERFGQFDGLDRVFDVAETDILATGMDKETFGKYWASHWTLPSMNMGYEMLHRRIIGDEDLDLLMEAQDVMPWWRDKLKAMSYNVVTRVDARRMHKLGILTDDQLVKVFMDQGYDQENAEAMAEFTIKYNYDPESSQTTEEDKEFQRLREASQSAIIKSYKKGIIDYNTAYAYLQDLGYATAAVELYLSNADFDLQEDIEDERVAAIHDAYIRSIYDYNKAVTLLGELNLPATYQTALLERWKIEREARLTKPSKAELLKMFANGIIDKATLVTELKSLGYSDKYVNWYLALQARTSQGGEA